MSAAANNFLKDRPLITVLLSFLGSLILAFTVRAANLNDEEKKDLKNTIEKKADKEYVDRSINETMINHEKLHEERDKNITDMFVIIREDQREMRRDIKELLQKD